MKHLLTCLLVMCPLAAAAQAPEAPRSVSDCERIKNDMAYNQCLASFGPKRGERAAGGGAEEDDGSVLRRSDRGGRGTRRSRGGRQAAAFDVVSSRPARQGRRAVPARDVDRLQATSRRRPRLKARNGTPESRLLSAASV
jgi:hypothetical protein